MQSKWMQGRRTGAWRLSARLLPALACLLWLAVATPASATPANAVSPPALVTGDSPPTQLGKDKHGDAVDLTAYRGKVVVVTFWASWCGYCLQELPALNDLQHQTGDQWLKIIAVNVEDSMRVYRPMLRQMKDYDLVMSRDPDGTIAKGYGVKGYPNLWMIDPQGHVASHHVGYGADSLNAIIVEIKRLLTIEMERQQAAAAS